MTMLCPLSFLQVSLTRPLGMASSRKTSEQEEDPASGQRTWREAQRWAWSVTCTTGINGPDPGHGHRPAGPQKAPLAEKGLHLPTDQPPNQVHLTACERPTPLSPSPNQHPEWCHQSPASQHRAFLATMGTWHCGSNQSTTSDSP